MPTTRHERLIDSAIGRVASCVTPSSLVIRRSPERFAEDVTGDA
ncbi:hypothetical protein [Micromonospora chersina]